MIGSNQLGVGIDHIIGIIVSVTFLFGVIAISSSCVPISDKFCSAAIELGKKECIVCSPRKPDNRQTKIANHGDMPCKLHSEGAPFG